MGVTHHLRGDRVAASQSFTEVLALTETFAGSIYVIAAAISLGQIQAADNNLLLASETYKRVLQVAGDPPQLIAVDAFLGLARINYQWNDLETAHQYGQQCAQLTEQQESIDTFASCLVFLARLKLVQKDVSGAAAVLAEAEAYVRQHNFLFRLPDVAAAQVRTLLRQGNVSAAAQLAEKHDLPLSQARVCLAQGDPHRALALLTPYRQQMAAKKWHDERLKIMILQALVLQAQGETDEAVRLLGEALALAESGGFIRIFVDEGVPMAQLLAETAVRGIMPDYTAKLLSVFDVVTQRYKANSFPSATLNGPSLLQPLTPSERKVLKLLATGLTGPEIARELMVSVNTMRTHTKNIYSKLGVNSRRTAVRRAVELNLL
jgi:LuxR family maltose regulon positive regulatory protein